MIGGPLFTMWLTPTEEELFLRYNPELQKRSLENRAKKQEDFNEFVSRLKEMSKSDKPIWEEQAIFEKERKRAGNLKPGKKESEEPAWEQGKDGTGRELKGIELRLAEEMLEKKKKLREETGPLVPGGSL